MVFWSAVQLQKLEAAIAVARKDIQANPKDAMQYVQLATLLHTAAAASLRQRTHTGTVME